MPERESSGKVRSTKSKPDTAKQEKNDVKKFLALAHSRFKMIAEGEAKTRQDALDDLKFSIGEQWPEDIRVQRTTEGKPCITMNRLPQTIRQVTNEQRQQRPAIQVNPTGSGASVKRAEIRQGIIRHIEVASESDIADDTAFDFLVRSGEGWSRVLPVDENESGEQEIRIDWVPNPFAVYSGPSTRPDGSDRRFLFYVVDMPLEEYENEYPESALAGLHDFTSIGDKVPEWANKQRNTVRVAEYFYLEGKGKNQQCYWSKINAIEILEGNEAKTSGREFPSKYIPWARCSGDDLIVDGRKHVAGIVRHMKEPMKMYNVMTSAATQSAMLAPLAPFVIAEGQVEGHEEEWRLSNRKLTAALTYKETSLNGTPIPPPSRNTAEPPIQAFAALLARCELDLQACSGIYNVNLGKSDSASQSGRAIGLLQKQSDTATLNFSDNLSRMIRFRGKILLDMIPRIYDTPRIMRIINPDSTVRHVVTHVGEDQASDAQEMTDGEDIKDVIDLGVGEYDCTVSVGPSFQTKRQQAVESQLEMLKILPPQIAVTLLDMVVRNMDWPQSQEMADRLKKQLPPNLLEGDGNDPQAQMQQLQAQLQQLSQQHQLLVQTATEQAKIIQNKQIEQQGKLAIVQVQEQSAQAMTKAKLDAQVAIAEVNTKSQEIGERIQWLQEVWKELHGAAHEKAMQDEQHAHEAQQAQAAQNAAAQSQNTQIQADQQAQAQQPQD